MQIGDPIVNYLDVSDANVPYQPYIIYDFSTREDISNDTKYWLFKSSMMTTRKDT